MEIWQRGSGMTRLGSPGLGQPVAALCEDAEDVNDKNDYVAGLPLADFVYERLKGAEASSSPPPPLSDPLRIVLPAGLFNVNIS